MTNKPVYLGVRYAAPRLWSIVVPTDTASLVMQVAPLVSVGTFVDTVFAPEVNSVVPGMHVMRRTAAVKRSIYVCTRTSSAMAGAPSAVLALSGTLATKSEQSYLIHGSRGGDVWLVGNNMMALRHAMYDYLARVGVKYLLPHPAWRVASNRNSLELDVSEVMAPVVSSFTWDGNGGLGSDTTPPIPGRAAGNANWRSWNQQTRQPSEIILGFGDGDEAFTLDRRKTIDHDHTMLAARKTGVMTGAPSLTFAATTVTRATGSWLTDGFINGGSFTVAGTTSNNGSKVITALSATVMTFGAGGGTAETTSAATITGWRRGFSESGPWPTGDCAAQANSLAKICMTHHGASGAGTRPASPAGLTGWQTIAASYWAETCAVDPPGGALSVDTGPDTGINPSVNYTAFGGLTEIYSTHHLQVICTRLIAYGYPHPLTRAVSCEPNDGANFCQCDRCTDLLRNGPYSAYLTLAQQAQDATPSDLVAHAMNELGASNDLHFANAGFKPMLGVLAYTTHTAPPSIPLYANSLVCVLFTGAPNYRALPSECLDQWVTKRATNPFGQFKIGMSPQWLTDNTNFSAPKWPSPEKGGALFASWIAKGFSQSNGQSGFSSMTMGSLFRVLSELCWRPTADIVALTNEFTDALGPAGPAIKAMFDRWAQWFEHCPQELAVAFRDVQAAQAALDAAPNPVTHEGRAKIQQRLDHIRMYVEWLRRFTEYLAAMDDYDRGKLTPSNVANPAVRVTLRAGKPSIFRIEIDGAGGPGTGTFKWSKNADSSHIVWDAVGVPIPGSGAGFTAALGSTGRSVVFANATYSVGQAWDEAPNKAPLIAAADRALEWAWRCGAGQFAGDPASNIIHSDRLWDRIAGGKDPTEPGTPHPFSNSSEGTTPPSITVQAIGTGNVTRPTAGTTEVTIRCTLGGARGTATLEYQVNNTGPWNAVTTGAQVTLAAAGIVVTCANATYNTDNRWYITVSPNLSKYNIYDSSASIGWSTLYAASKAQLDALVADGVATYVPLSGVQRYVYDETSFQPFNPSALTTLHNGPQYSSPHAYRIRKPAGTVTLKLSSTGLGTLIGQPVRVLLQNAQTGATLQEWSFQPTMSTTVVNDIVLTQPAGDYRLVVIDVPVTNTLSLLQVPENVGCVNYNDWLDAPMATTRGFSASTKFAIYVPPGAGKLVMAFRQSLTVTNGIRFYDPSGAAVATTYMAPNQWVCDVGAGQDNAGWEFDGYYPYNNQSVPFFWTCPNRIAPSKRQLLIP